MHRKRLGTRRLSRARMVSTVVAVAVFSLAFAGGTASAANPGAKADKDADFSYAISFGYQNLDPHRGLSSGPWLRPLYENLVDFSLKNGKLEIVPELAKSFEISSDNRRVTFTLLKGIKFQDGAQFDAQAVVANIDRAKNDPRSAVKSLLTDVSSVQATDTYTVVFNLANTNTGGFLANLVRDEVGSMISPAAIRSGVDLSTNPAGTGPFKLVSAQQNAEVVYERWDGYRNRKDVWIKQLRIYTTVDINARFNGLRSGSFDAIQLPKELESEAAKQTGWWSQTVSGGVVAMFLNVNRPLFQDINVRRAIDMSIPREAISKSLLSGTGKPAYQPFIPGFVGYDEKLAKDRYDPKKAKKLANSAGVDGSTTLRFLHSTTAPVPEIAQVIQERLADLGIKAQLEPASASASRTLWRSGNYDLFVSSTRYGVDPSSTLDLTFLAGGDVVAPPPAELQTMADRAKGLPLGSREREKAYQEISRWITENVHYEIPVYYDWYTVYARANTIMPKIFMKNNIVDPEFIKVGIKKSK
jgi:peptide/nickel transport system substrate-binding protein